MIEQKYKLGETVKESETEVSLQTLSQLYYLRREIDTDIARLAALEAAATSTAANVSGMPRASGIADKTSLAADIADLRAIIEGKYKRALGEYRRLTDYICTVDDSFMRQILTYRFANGLTWTQVAQRVGGGNTADGVRKACKRFIAKKRKLSALSALDVV